MSASAEMDVCVVYGMGGKITRRFSRHEIEEIPARDLVGRVIDGTQPAGPAARTANALGEVLRSNREIDVELSHGSIHEAGYGQPITLDQVIVRGPRDVPQSPERDDLTIRISESYVGGQVCQTDSPGYGKS